MGSIDIRSFILCERGTAWVTLLRRHVPAAVRLRQISTLSECAAELAERPASLLALEVTRENLAEVLALMSGLGRGFPRARAIALADRGMKAYEWPLREAGAAHFTDSPRRLEGIAHLAERHFGGAAASRAAFAAGVWDSLPWSEAAMAR